jgi:hypothetical protein
LQVKAVFLRILIIIITLFSPKLPNVFFCRHIQKQKGVTFAGYKMPHPLDHKFVLKVQTEKPLTPPQALERTVDNLIADLASLEERVRVSLECVFLRKSNIVF